MANSIFHEQWWLDAVALNGWGEAIVERNGAPVARLPYASQKRYGLTLLTAPPLTNRLGPQFAPSEGKYHRKVGAQYELVEQLVDALPDFDIFRENLRSDSLSWYGWQRVGAVVEPRLSYVCDGLADLDAVWRGISDKTRNVIRKAERTLSVAADDDAVALLQMAQSTFERQGTALPYAPAVLRRLAAAVLDRDKGAIFTARDTAGRVHASVFVVFDADRAYYLVGGADPALRSSGASSLLIWHAIKASAERVGVFDFEGSVIPGVEKSFRSFGGAQETYFRVTMMSRRMKVLWSVRGIAEAMEVIGGST